MTTPQTPNIVSLHVVDYGAPGEYDIFGKVVCEREDEAFDLWRLHGPHVAILEVEEIPAVRG